MTRKYVTYLESPPGALGLLSNIEVGFSICLREGVANDEPKDTVIGSTLSVSFSPSFSPSFFSSFSHSPYNTRRVSGSSNTGP